MRKRLMRSGFDPRLSPNRACVGLDTDSFFAETDAEALVAQRVCEWCPVLAGCAAWALREEMSDGVFGSVRLPKVGASSKEWEAARGLLELVAATGGQSTDDLKAVA